MLHFSQYVIVRQMAGILDMAALGASEAPADSAFNLKGALRPAVRDDDVEYEGMCRCLVEMLLNKEGMFCELYDKDDKFLGLNRIRHRLVPGVWGYDCVLGDCVLGDLGRRRDGRLLVDVPDVVRDVQGASRARRGA